MEIFCHFPCFLWHSCFKHHLVFNAYWFICLLVLHEKPTKTRPAGLHVMFGMKVCFLQLRFNVQYQEVNCKLLKQYTSSSSVSWSVILLGSHKMRSDCFTLHVLVFLGSKLALLLAIGKGSHIPNGLYLGLQMLVIKLSLPPPVLQVGQGGNWWGWFYGWLLGFHLGDSIPWSTVNWHLQHFLRWLLGASLVHQLRSPLFPLSPFSVLLLSTIFSLPFYNLWMPFLLDPSDPDTPHWIPPFPEGSPTLWTFWPSPFCHLPIKDSGGVGNLKAGNVGTFQGQLGWNTQGVAHH